MGPGLNYYLLGIIGSYLYTTHLTLRFRVAHLRVERFFTDCFLTM